MERSSRPCRLAFLLVTAGLLCTGCALSSLPYFLGPEPKLPAQFVSLIPEEKDKEIRVVILTHNGVETRPEFITVDHELTNMLAQNIQEEAKEHKGKVTIVAPRKVREFKTSHPDWYTWELEKIGKHFDEPDGKEPGKPVDYVVFLQVNTMSLYLERSHNMFFHGQARITVTVADMNDSDYDPKEMQFVCEYPRSSGPVPVDDQTPPELFRQKFMTFLAKQLSYNFVPHLTRDDLGRD